MKRIYPLTILFLILTIFLSGCGGVVTPSVNSSGNWTMTNTTTFTTSSLIADIGAVTTSKCNIVDNSGSLTIYNFYIVGQPFINWSTGYGTFKNSIITANISGSYLNVYGSTVSLVIYFEGTINPDGISGSGTWTQTISVYGYLDSASGTTTFIKG
ncbi:hypothetical protein ES695_18890 [Candidatus Atribacteria bacterium 1244-E10-H5-B2]|nr:MAG: hypothetical protein ES695_18890 [Candidatus Atribacteria bacterium 1244-E10-H5-B2]